MRSYKLMSRVLLVLTVVVLCVIVFAAVQHKIQGKKELERLGSPPAGIDSYFVQNQHASRTVTGYQDLSMQPWQVWFRYRNCQVTRRGAFRVTVYKIHGTPSERLHIPRSAQQITETLVLRSPSGGGTYQYPGSQETSYFYKVEVPGKRGCASWSYGGLTN